MSELRPVWHTVYAEDLAAFPTDDPASWVVCRGDDQVGVLELRRAGGTVWVAGRVDEDLVAEGPTALAVLRRLSCRAGARSMQSIPASPEWT